DAVSAKAAGPAYTRRWDAERTAWMRDRAGDDASATGPAGAGLNLSALNNQEQEQVSPEDEMLRRFRAQIDAQFGTAPEPQSPANDGPPVAGGLNLSALRGEREQGPSWLPAVLETIKASGAEGMKPSAIAEQIGKDRKTVRAALQAAVERGQLVYRDNGPHSVYVHPDHA
ncbi:hypothetical protein ABZ299_01740, partial [Streptomyces sp. NPDC006184]